MQKKVLKRLFPLCKILFVSFDFWSANLTDFVSVCVGVCVCVRAFMRSEICPFLCRGSSQYLTELFQTLSLLEILHVSSVYLGMRSHDVVFGPCLGCTAWTLSLFKDTTEVTLNSLLCLIVGFLLWHVHSWRQPSIR